jgi:hypothetical protein
MAKRAIDELLRILEKCESGEFMLSDKGRHDAADFARQVRRELDAAKKRKGKT